MRSAAVIDSCRFAMIQPSASIGQISISSSETNATRPPIVMPLLATAYAPPTSTVASVMLGTRSKRAQVRAWRFALLTAGVVDEAGACLEPCRHLVTAAERLDRPEPLRRLFDQRGEVALLVLHQAGCREVVLGEVLAEVEQRHRADRDDHGEWPVEVEQQGDHGDVGADVDDQEDQAERHEPADHAEVAGRPGQQLAGLPLVVERDRQALQVRVQVVALGGLHAERGRALRPPADEDQHSLQETEQECESAEFEQAAGLVVGDRAVDDAVGQPAERRCSPRWHQPPRRASRPCAMRTAGGSRASARGCVGAGDWFATRQATTRHRP